MKRIRAGEAVRGAARIGALLAVMVWAAATWLIRPAARRDLAARARWLQRTCRRALRVLGVRVVADGAPPEGGALAVANHLGYLDILVLAAETPSVFVAKQEVSGWPLFGWMAARAGTRFIDRERRRDVTRVAAQLAEAVTAGVQVVVFLEGTSTAGHEVRPFKSSLLEPAVAAGWRVVPVALHYEVPPGRSAAEEVCWWGEMRLVPHLANFSTLPWVRARVGWGEAFAGFGERKVLAETLRVQVLTLKNTLIPPAS